MPFVEKYSARRKLRIKTPLLGLVIISIMVSLTEAQAISGIKSSIRLSRVCWKFAMGINGIIENRKIRKGKIARKKVNEMADALVAIYPCCIPLKKKPNTLYRGSPSKPGRMIFFESRMRKAMGSQSRNR
jgi:hypothetical protein